MRSSQDPVYVESAARLHFGVLDLRGSLGRWFGGIGAAAPGPTLLVSASPSDVLDVQGEDADRAREAAQSFLEHHGVTGGATLLVHRGTQRDFIGFNRACHAVLEAAIYATRVHLLPRAFLEGELARLQIIVDKTAGPRELEAMALLTDYIRSAPLGAESA